MRLIWPVIPLVIFSVIGIQESFAEQASGKPAWEINSDKVCGDKLCSEIDKSVEDTSLNQNSYYYLAGCQHILYTGDGFWEHIPPPSFTVIDQFGNSLDTIGKNEQFEIEFGFWNEKNIEQPFAAIIQIKDSEGFVVFLSWVMGVMSSEERINSYFSLNMSNPGEYTISGFVWDSLAGENILCESASTDFRIR